MAFALVKNTAGNMVSPSVESVTAAIAGAVIPEDFRFSMVNPAGEHAYPIAGVTWLLVYERQKDPAKGRKLVEFLNWSMNEGQAQVASLDYAPLPESIRQRVLDRIKTIKY